MTSYQDQEAKLSTTLQENLTGVRVVKAFARQSYEIEKFDRENWEKYRRGKKLLIMHSLYWPISDVLCAGQTILVMAVGAMMAMRGEITVGTYVAVMGMVIWIIWPMRNLGRLIVQMSTGLGFVPPCGRHDRAGSRGHRQRDGVARDAHSRRGDVRERQLLLRTEGGLAGTREDKKEKEGRRTGEEGSEELKPVEVLHDISFHCEPGDVVALLGSTGSGKTSIINLLLRFYDYQEGSILLDGVELKDYPRGLLRRNVGIVEQEPFLFSRSIRENIAYGRSRA